MAIDSDLFFHLPEALPHPFMLAEYAGTLPLRKLHDVLDRTAGRSTEPVTNLNWVWTPEISDKKYDPNAQPIIPFLGAVYGMVAKLHIDESSRSQDQEQPAELEKNVAIFGLTNIAQLLGHAAENEVPWSEKRLWVIGNREPLHKVDVHRGPEHLEAFFSPDVKSFGVHWFDQHPAKLRWLAANRTARFAEIQTFIHDHSRQQQPSKLILNFDAKFIHNTGEGSAQRLLTSPNIMPCLLGGNRQQIVLGKGTFAACRDAQFSIMRDLNLSVLSHRNLPSEPVENQK